MASKDGVFCQSSLGQRGGEPRIPKTDSLQFIVVDIYPSSVSFFLNNPMTYC